MSIHEYPDDYQKQTERGWYKCWATDDRWEGQPRYRGWGNGCWWIPLADGWISSDHPYTWQGPLADIMGPAPDGTNPKSEPSAQANEEER
jgi:hypothetical protein